MGIVYRNLDFLLLLKNWRTGQHWISNIFLQCLATMSWRWGAAAPFTPIPTQPSSPICSTCWPLVSVWICNFLSKCVFVQVLPSSVSDHTVKYPELISNKNLNQASPSTISGQHNPLAKQLSKVSRTFQMSTLLDPIISPWQLHLKETSPSVLQVKVHYDSIYNGKQLEATRKLMLKSRVAILFILWVLMHRYETDVNWGSFY